MTAANALAQTIHTFNTNPLTPKPTAMRSSTATWCGA